MDQIVAFISNLFSSSGFVARWNCGKWSDFHGWLYIISSLAIFIAYFSIPILIIVFLRKKRNVPFKGTFLLFVSFIIFCGITHLFDAIIFWNPLYRLSSVLLFITAVVSCYTVYSLYKTIPMALEMKTPEELDIIIKEKTKALKNINELLANSERNFSILVNTNPDLICRFDADKNIIFVNDTIEKLTQSKASEFIGKHISEFNYPLEFLQTFIENMDKSIATNETVVMNTSPTVGPMKEKHFSITFVPYVVSGNEIDVFTITKDVTKEKNHGILLQNNIQELQILSNRLNKKTQKLQNFAYIVSHNLRSPLAGINGLINLYDKVHTSEEKTEILNNLKIVTDTLNQTIEDLTEVVHINQNLAIDTEELSLTKITEKVIESIQPQIIATNTRIAIDFSKQDKIYFSKIYLESIILNLLTNAIKYRRNNVVNEIIIYTTVESDQCRLYFKDNGIGMDMNRIGHKLFGLHKTFHGNKDARGVGLYITKTQIEELGGSIIAKSELDKGTTFIITFDDNEKN